MRGNSLGVERLEYQPTVTRPGSEIRMEGMKAAKREVKDQKAEWGTLDSVEAAGEAKGR